MTQPAREWFAVCMDAHKDPHKDSIFRFNSLAFPASFFPHLFFIFVHHYFHSACVGCSAKAAHRGFCRGGEYCL